MTILSGVDLTAAIINDEFAGMLTNFGNTATVSTIQSTASTSYTDLATAGPAVTLTSVGTRALVIISARIFATTAAADICAMSVTVSGATTIAAADASALMQNGATGSSGGGLGVESGTAFIYSITPGSNTYTAKYKAGVNTANFADRKIFVFAP